MRKKKGKGKAPSAKGGRGGKPKAQPASKTQRSGTRVSARRDKVTIADAVLAIPDGVLV